MGRILLALVLAGGAFGQAGGPAFDVASVKLQPWTGQQGCAGCIQVRGNTLTAEHVDLYSLIWYAYGLRTDGQLSGGPAWALGSGMLDERTLYQVIAKTGDPNPPRDQFPLMMQTLLAERFQLKIHHVQKVLPVFHLVVVKGGTKLKENTSDDKMSMAMSGAKVLRIVAKHAPLTNLVGQLSVAANRPVIDKTGLTGFYDFELRWTPGALDASATDAPGDSIFTALQDQLGLKLEATTAPFDTVVIDHAEKPSEN